MDKHARWRKYVPSSCDECGREISIRSDNLRAHHFCDRSCRQKWLLKNKPGLLERVRANIREVSSRPEVQERIQEHLHSDSNPFRDPKVRAKAVLKAREKGTYEKNLQGGNGRGPTIPQLLLATRLGWAYELIIPTKEVGGRKAGYPYAYKVDVGDWDLKIAIEIDGPSHNNSQTRARDQKKDDCLTSLGWKVLRVTNKQVLKDLDRVIASVMDLL